MLQVGRSLYLLGKHRAAGEVYDEAIKLQDDDAELWLHKGMCAVQLRDYDRCECWHCLHSVPWHAWQCCTVWGSSPHSWQLLQHASSRLRHDGTCSCATSRVCGVLKHTGRCSPFRRPTPSSLMTTPTCRCGRIATAEEPPLQQTHTMAMRSISRSGQALQTKPNNAAAAASKLLA